MLRLRGIADPDAWSLLDVDASDPRIIGVNHYEWDARLHELPASPPQGPRVLIIEPTALLESFRRPNLKGLRAPLAARPRVA